MQNLFWQGSKCPDALYTFPIVSHEGPVNEEESKIDISHDLWCGKTLNQWTPHTNRGQKRTPHLTFLSWGETHCTGASRAFADHWPPLFHLLGRNLELHPQSLDLKPIWPLKCPMFNAEWPKRVEAIKPFQPKWELHWWEGECPSIIYSWPLLQ